LECDNFRPARLTIENSPIKNSQIKNSAGFGLHVDAVVCVLDIDAVTMFVSNALADTN